MSQIENSDEIYYHYTSIHAFYNIISSKSLWLTSLKTSNDKEELFYNYQLYKEDCQKVIPHFNPQYQKVLLDILELEKERFLEIENFKSHPFGLSFTNQADNLAHWSLYANNQKGITLGISKKEFMNSVYNKEKLEYSLMSLPWMKVCYTHEERQQCIYTMIKNSLTLYERYLSRGNPFNHDIAASFVYLPFHMLKKFCKNEKFKVEEESRIFWEQSYLEYYKIIFKYNGELHPLYKTFIEECENIRTKCQISESENFQIFGETIKPYLSLNLSSCWNSSLIKEVIIGPKCPQHEENLRLFLDNHGLTETEIKVSKIPLR